MKIIALEEHFRNAAIEEDVKNALPPSQRDSVVASRETLDVPLYLHPTVPSKAVQDAYYTGLDPVTSGQFATFGWGWHMETGIHALRLILAGIFDHHPRLQVILGHWGEMIPFFLARINEAVVASSEVSYYFLENFYATPSGMFTLPPFLNTLQMICAHRIACIPSIRERIIPSLQSMVCCGRKKCL